MYHPKVMEKTAYLLAGILVIIGVIIIIILSNPSITGLSISEQKQPKIHAWTKAVCDKDNFCQDYLIECNGQEPIKLSPITGASVQFDKDWQDPRTLEQRERLC